jgi:hypothetical protein
MCDTTADAEKTNVDCPEVPVAKPVPDNKPCKDCRKAATGKAKAAKEEAKKPGAAKKKK